MALTKLFGGGIPEYINLPDRRQVRARPPLATLCLLLPPWRSASCTTVVSAELPTKDAALPKQQFTLF